MNMVVILRSGGPSCIPSLPFALLSPKAISFSCSSLSVCGFCRRILLPNKFPVNCMLSSLMSNACLGRFCGTCHKAAASLYPRKSHGIGILRTMSPCTSTGTFPATPPIVRPPSTIVLAAHITPPDAPQRSEEWFALRRDKLTTSTFSTALGFWKGNRRFELWHEKVFESGTEILQTSKKSAMEWGVLNEAAAIDRYRSITGREVSALGFATHSEERFDWIGASPDGLLDCFPEGGILEVKCPYNKGKPEMGLPWSTMPFYYMPQVQGQMEIMDREWVDLYCWTPNGSSIFRVDRERGYWELIHGILREFWWENVIPAREAVLLRSKEEAMSYKPTSTHKRTGLAIFKSIKLASEAKLLCKEIAGHIEFYR
ncbi:hypothetical protein I3842_05G168900 [Carya illinoinensis]|uniref:YqaJ viral recombinase domain-containing protein n=2 Tax=Carya illinoinensis TaxID=32201 RepID=A0A922F5R9_CARIL|nr:hypothetical protein I3842_05G168900 [Carya illinoinensis]